MNNTLKTLYDKLGTYQDFPKEGVTFKDIFPLLEDMTLTDVLIDAIYDTLPADITCIVAPESRGFLLGILTSYISEVKFVPLRKPGKLPGEVLNVSYETEYSTDELEIKKNAVKGETCWFIDDIYATGGTYYAAEALVKKCGGKLTGGTVLLDVLNSNNPKIVELFKDVKE